MRTAPSVSVSGAWPIGRNLRKPPPELGKRPGKTHPPQERERRTPVRSHKASGSRKRRTSVTVSVHTRASVGVQVRVWARSTNYVANELQRVLQEVVQHRGLPMDYMHDHHKTLSEGFRTWLTQRHLQGVILEIYDP